MTVDETTTVPAGCVLAGAEVTAVDGVAVDPAPVPYGTTAPSPARAVEVTNRVTCPPMLTLVKEVVNDDAGGAVARDWTLSATGPDRIEGVTGEASVAHAHVAAGDYALAEAGPAGNAALGWVCVDDLTGAPADVVDGVVSVGPDDALTCTVTNDDVAQPLPSPGVTTPSVADPPPPAGSGAPGSGSLPTTGAAVGGLLAAATVLGLIGWALLAATRRRRAA